VSRVAAPADRRFRRAHVKPARKRRRWEGWLRTLVRSALILTVTVYGIYRGTSVVAHARILQVDRIVVRGNGRLSNGEVLAVLNGLRGENLVWTDLDRWRRRLMASPWVRDAALRRSLPSTVEVDLSERQPVGIGRLKGELYLVDDRGIVIDQYGPQYADLDLPIIDGLGVAGDASSLTDQARAELAARILISVRERPEIARRVSQIDVTDVHNASVILNGDSAVVYVGEEAFVQRLQSYVGLASALRERVADIDYVDLRFDDRIYVRPVAASTKRASAVAASSVSSRRRH